MRAAQADLPIYLDHLATTPLDPRVLEAMLPFYTTDFGNPSSTHAFGYRAKAAVETAREAVARLIGARAREIVFTSGATEANNLVIRGLMAHDPSSKHIITGATEHPAVLDVCEAVTRMGGEVTILPVAASGQVDPQQLREALRKQTCLVSLMAANNETGTIHPLREIGAVMAEHPALWHCDAAQATGKIPIDVDDLGIDLLSISAHKLYGPKGQGALFVRRRRPAIRLTPLLEGGGQERGLRSGTLNVPGIVGLGSACDLAAAELPQEMARLRRLRAHLIKCLQAIPSIQVNGHPEHHLPGCLNVTFGGHDGRDLMLRVQDEIALSAGAACASTHQGPSHVLAAMGLTDAAAVSTLRFGLGRHTTLEQVERAADVVVRACQQSAPLAG